MDLFIGLATYLILWWMSFFAVLPIGAGSHHEAGDRIEPGHERGAPRAPRLLTKAGWAAGIAAALWVLVFVLLYFTYFSR